MTKIVNGVIITNDHSHLYDVGLMVYLDDSNPEVMFVCRNVEDKAYIYGSKSIWQISPKVNSRSSIFFGPSGRLSDIEFFEFMRSNYQEDLMWLLFHPEIYESKYYVE